MYNYKEAIADDIRDWITENYTTDEIAQRLSDRYEWEQNLYDELWIADSVTGNASGSYYCNAYKAEEAIAHNWDLLADALCEFGQSDINPIEKGAEWCDVTIRCFLLEECLCCALDDIEAYRRRNYA